jgi:hypothetical protein
MTTQAQDNGISYVTWTDPHENAFSLEVPQGWNVEGGSSRTNNNLANYRYYVRAISPGGEIILNVGDPRVSITYMEQNSMLGSNQRIINDLTRSLNIPTQQSPFPISPRLTGQQFAEAYLRTYPEYGTTGIEVTYSNDYGHSNQADFGIIKYTCYKNGEQMAGAVSAETATTPIGDWMLSSLSSYLAPRPQETLALSVINHMVKTFKWDSRWVYANANLANQISSAWSTAREHSAQDWDLYIRDTTLVEDTNNQLYEVPNAPEQEYYWNCGGKIITTSTPDKPDPSCTPAKESQWIDQTALDTWDKAINS